jgi:hypothetical protein
LEAHATVSQYYQELDQGHFDYRLATLANVPDEAFRGPPPDPGPPYIAFVGAAQTFGRFCDDPFPALLARRLDVQAVNLGVGGVGPRYFAAPHFARWLDGARLVVLQVLAGRSSGNSLFDNTSTGTLQGVRVRDGTPMRFEDFLAELVRDESTATVRRVVDETRDSYVAEMLELIRRIRSPKILFWMSTRPPEYVEDWTSPWGVMGAFPQLINRTVVDHLAVACEAFVECVTDTGLPQPLWPAGEQVLGTELRDGMLYNTYYPSPAMHVVAADHLEPVCREILSRVTR